MAVSPSFARFVATLVLAAGLAACAGNKAEKFANVEEPVEVLYNDAVTQLQRRRFSEAVRLFEEVERQHPYSAWARRAMLMGAFAQYQANEYEEALETIDRFIALHPGNKDAPYAYYLRAMCYYERILDVARDQEITNQALAALTDVVRRYPDSEYARDARLKLDLTQDHLAGKEMDVGRWYLRKNHHIAAINRFKTVVDRYQTTSHVPEALHRLVESYLELGIVPEARQVAAVLGYNYPGSEWYEDAYDLFEKYGYKMTEQRLARQASGRDAKSDAEERPERIEPIMPPPPGAALEATPDRSPTRTIDPGPAAPNRDPGAN